MHIMTKRGWQRIVIRGLVPLQKDPTWLASMGLSEDPEAHDRMVARYCGAIHDYLAGRIDKDHLAAQMGQRL